ncbi:hypothetical protein BT96DRAFT_965769 [Gymnopus androsaceus JB14]|uniref:Uncharacterized protein n=1 Tax=Gymnopus androsaceus JB14 TaxID=1447944 RepID=A0A6A4HN24_9AGAR|nr:hypothetical protein BT96DRAFT_965769 [Gymnopus androsaceus JB14]
MAFSSPPKKRKRDREDEGSLSLPGSPARSGKRPMHVMPAPKRPTVASQRRQHKKLTTPFKSPLMMKTAKLEEEKEPHLSQNTPLASANKPSAIESKKKHFTARAAAQFKSPLSSTGNANSSQSLGSIRLTPSIQVLERKIQILKRAVKVKKDKEEEALSDLTTRWTEAGREVAWEVWELVKDSENSSGKRSFKEGWGWEGQGNEKRAKSEGGDSWGWSTRTESTDENAMHQDEQELGVKEQQMDEDEERVEYTLGMMLRRLGIDPATLGWDDEEGIFKDP